MLRLRYVRLCSRRSSRMGARAVIQGLILLILFAPACLFAQKTNPSPSAEDGILRSQKTILYDEEQVKKVPPERRDILNKRLWEAGELYEKRDYTHAVAIMKEIADESETTNIMFLIGKGSMRTGDLPRAEAQFKKLLAIDPDLKRVRLELALIYFDTRRYDEAKKELKTVKATHPPREVADNIERLLTAIDEATRRFFFNFFLSEGIQYDTNVSSGPDDRKFNVTGGTLTITPEQKKIQDWASVTMLQAGVLYDIGERQGLYWNTTLDFYKSAYFGYGRFNYMRHGRHDRAGVGG